MGERPLGVAGRERLLQRGGVAPERVLGHADLVIASAGHDLRAELGPEEVERAPERGARMLLVELRPEEPQQQVTPVMAPRRRDREIRQQPQPLRLLEHRPNLAIAVVAEVQWAKGVEAEHGRANVSWDLGEGNGF